MDWTAPLLAVGGGILFGAMSPGPSFVVVARTSLAASRANGLSAALGMGIGGAAFAFAAVMGLVAILTAVPVVYTTLKVAGGLYLLFLAYRMWTSSARPLSFAAPANAVPVSLTKSFWVGLATQISNPKTAIVYASIFAVALPADASYMLGAACVGLIFTIEAGWYGLVAVVFSLDRPRAGYLASKTLFDRLAATAMGTLGLKVLSDAR